MSIIVLLINVQDTIQPVPYSVSKPYAFEHCMEKVAYPKASFHDLLNVPKQSIKREESRHILSFMGPVLAQQARDCDCRHLKNQTSHILILSQTIRSITTIN
jgi:hypothetical protein